ncbi:MAG: selenide, water dikinase SelD [Lachnospiraceae bacterium]|nr:selenide, water dikinase SelD [Lachnospiraceae bacterium]
METKVRLTKLADCAGCGAKVGAGTLAALLDGFKTRQDPNLLVGYDRSDDACVYQVDEEKAIISTADFFPPIVDDPFSFGQIAAANAMSDVYAMGGKPTMALNILCVTEALSDEAVREILRGGYDKVYEAEAVIGGGHTIKGQEPLYGLSVTGMVSPNRILKNCSARPGDVLILTKPLGIGILTTAMKAEMTDKEINQKIIRQMATLNRGAAEVMQNYKIDSCTDVTGFALMGHSFEMAQGSDVAIHLMADQIPYHKEAEGMARLGLIPAGAYRNRKFAEAGVELKKDIPKFLEDIFYDPQTSGGLLIAVPEKEANQFFDQLQAEVPQSAIVGYVTDRSQMAEGKYIVIE